MRIRIHHILHTCAAAATTAIMATATTGCSDTLINTGTDNGEGYDGEDIGFTMEVKEAHQRLIAIGQTRAAKDDSTLVVECPPQNRPLKGKVTGGLLLNRLGIPEMGSLPRAYSTNTETQTRASANDIVTHARNNFPDSISIFGFAFNFDDDISADLPSGSATQAQLQKAYETQRLLFNENGTLLNRIRDWRSSVHWPYDKQAMRFCSLAPCIEQTDITVVGRPHFERSGSEGSYTYAVSPPIFRFKVPDDINRQHDMLYGESPVIPVQSGPKGDGEQRNPNLGDDNKRVNITYDHILTAVRFARGKLPAGFIITNIRLENIANEGNFHADPDNPTSAGTWNLTENEHLEATPTPRNGHYDVATYYKSEHGGYGGVGDEAITSTDPAYYIDKNQVLFLMPHTCSSEAKMEVTLLVPDNDGNILIPSESSDPNAVQISTPGTYVIMEYDADEGRLEGSTAEFSETAYYLRYTEHTPSVSLEGDEWKMGHEVTYMLSINTLRSGYQMLVSSEPLAMEHYESGGLDGSFSIRSYAAKKDYSSTGAGEEVSGGASSSLKFSIVGYSNSEDGTFSIDNKPDWLTISNNLTETNPSLNLYTVQYHIQAQQYDTNYPHGNHREQLRSNRRKDNVDLSTQTPNGNAFTPVSGLRETANCYIINRQGSYRFPMVYGNALYIKQSASDPETQGATPLSGFYDHRGAPITNAWIREHLPHASMPHPSNLPNFTPPEPASSSTVYDYEYKAELVWQDAEDLVKGVDIYAQNNQFIYFEVDQTHIKPGNAVIALMGRQLKKTITLNERVTAGSRNEEKVIGEPSTEDCGYGTKTTTIKEYTYSNGEGGFTTDKVTETIEPTEDYAVVWTWHIWATDQIYANQSGDGETSIDVGGTKVMPVNLGWVPNDDEWGSYARRSIYARFKQNSVNNYVTVHIVQDARPDLPTGRTTLYQWGRPTALPMLKANATSESTSVNIYDKNGTDITSSCTFLDASSVSDAIQNPLQILTSWNPVSTTLWSSATKSIYDPCPAGFRLPPASLFSVTALSGHDSPPINETDNLNMWGEYKNDAPSFTARSGMLQYGGYFHATRAAFRGKGTVMTDADIIARYGTYEKDATTHTYKYVPNPSMLYLPATGWWPAGAAGNSYGGAIEERDGARYWTGDDGKYIFVLPSRPTTNSTSSPVANWDISTSKSTSMSIRPIGSVIGN